MNFMKNMKISDFPFGMNYEKNRKNSNANTSEQLHVKYEKLLTLSSGGNMRKIGKIPTPIYISEELHEKYEK